MEIAVWRQLSTYNIIDLFWGKPFGFSLKNKSQRFGNALRGRPLLQVAPSFSNSPPDCWRNSPPVERTASSASRKCVSFFRIPDLEGFSSCEKAYESVPCANKGLCPFETCKPLKRLDLNFYDFLFQKAF